MTDVSQVFESSRPPVLVPAVVALAAASSHDARLSALPSPIDDPAAQPEEELAIGDECPGCGGWGGVTCPACDGTGVWTEASESAGLYQREAARALAPRSPRFRSQQRHSQRTGFPHSADESAERASSLVPFPKLGNPITQKRATGTLVPLTR